MERKALTLAVLIAALSVASCCFDPFYPYGVERGDTELTALDNEIFTIDMNTTFDFYGDQYDKVYLHVDGLISFREGSLPPYPQTTPSDKPIAAVFWMNLTFPDDKWSRLYYRKVNLTEERDVALIIEADSAALGERFTPNGAFIATWIDAVSISDYGYAWHSFQLVFASNGTKSVTVFNYGGMFIVDEEHPFPVGFNKGNGMRASYPVSQYYLNTISTTNIPGRIVTRVDGDIQLPNLTEIWCGGCRSLSRDNRVRTFDFSEHLRTSITERVYLLSKYDQSHLAGNRDPCQFMLTATTNGNKNIDRVAFSVGIGTDNTTKYKHTYEITANGNTAVITRDGEKINGLPHYDVIDDSLQKLVVVIKNDPYWTKIHSPMCQYYVGFMPYYGSSRIDLALGPYYKGNVFGMCQNYNDNAADDDKLCSSSPQAASDAAVIDSCSCPLNDYQCISELENM